VKQAIENSIRHLELFPYSAPATDEPGVHELIVPRRPYKVFYRVVGEEVWIVHIIAMPRAGRGRGRAISGANSLQ
jgi:plasmid stabilization system protein ParE